MTNENETPKTTSAYTIDNDGIDGRWRVYWLREVDGYGVERLFDSREAAEQWVEFMESLETA